MVLAEPFPQALDALPGVCHRFHVRRLDLFGSASTGHGFEPERSDLDLLVSFEPLAPTEYAQAYFGLLEALEVLAGRPIDLVTEAALKNPYLRRRVEAERIPLFPPP
jgi:predicted nucleotidyltransferase